MPILSTVVETLISSCHWKSLAPLWLRKKRFKNAFLILIMNCRKIVHKNKLCSPKQQNIGYLICYLFIACFDREIGFSQQTVVRVHYIFNSM